MAARLQNEAAPPPPKKKKKTNDTKNGLKNEDKDPKTIRNVELKQFFTARICRGGHANKKTACEQRRVNGGL